MACGYKKLLEPNSIGKDESASWKYFHWNQRFTPMLLRVEIEGFLIPRCLRVVGWS